MFLHEIIFNNKKDYTNIYEFYIERNKNQKGIIYVIKGDIACKIQIKNKNIKLLDRIPKNNILKKLNIFKKISFNQNNINILNKIENLLTEFSEINYAGKYNKKIIEEIPIEDPFMEKIIFEASINKNKNLKFQEEEKLNYKI